MRPLVALVLVFLASVAVGGLLHLFQPTSPTVPQPTAPSSTPADPYAWYRSLPTATPGCPTDLTPELRKYYFRRCPPGGATK
jgi:hypothetical protein